MTSNEEILCTVHGSIGHIKLNRPGNLNALSFDMLSALLNTLREWEIDDSVAFIILEGEGEKAFCSGGDVRKLYDLRNDNVDEYAFRFFSTEYRMNITMHRYSKPILVYMNGYVMGGGVGISVGASHRIVTEKTIWAMPEMDIGLYPDVGGSYFLPKMKNYIGRYLALTSKTVRGEDALHIGAADYYMQSEKWPELKNEAENTVWTQANAGKQLELLLGRFSSKPEKQAQLAGLEDKIREHFKFESIEEITAALQASADNGDSWAEQTLQAINKKSPTSLKVTLRQLVNGQNLELERCFEMELNMSMNFMKCHDFFEGVRSVLVDKDRNPKWDPAALSEISEDTVESFFSYGWKNGKNPLPDNSVTEL